MRECPWLLVMSRWLRAFILIVLFERTNYNDKKGAYGMDEGTLSKTKEMLDDMHKRKIDMADGIYVINVGGYIGESTRSEIEYAKALGKSVDYLERL